MSSYTVVKGDLLPCKWCGTKLAVEVGSNGKLRIPLPEHITSGECETANLTDGQIAREVRV
jgi:hypothetical protein